MRSILDDKSQKKSLPDGWTETMLQDHITHVLRGNISNNPLTVLDQSKLMSLRSCPSLAAVKKAKLSDDTTPMGEPKSAFAIEEEQTSNFTPERSLFSITPVSSFASKDNVQDVEMTAIEEPDAKMRVES
ncbi:hypothetical protein GYMLUDRAFT_351644 [Collybiopsis luxurians FD-317 M1]|nr:hypothetical protein GYMLUDRAFT_351644 [Collybiopsis luxurians FD-317 M1]